MSTRRTRARRRKGGLIDRTGPIFSWAMLRSADKFMRQTAQYRELSEKTLDQLLALSRKTEYGRRCGLDGKAPRKVFETLPTTTYSNYAAYVDRMAAGEQNVLSGDPVIYFSTTSGTTGPAKMIPVTQRHMTSSILERFVSMGLAVRAGALKPMHGPFMTIMTEHLGGLTEGGFPKGAATTGGFKKLGRIQDLILSSPAEVVRVHNQTASRYLHLLFGLRHELLWTIVAFFPATILFAMRDLLANGEQLVRDLADGTINEQLELPTETRANLLKLLRPERDRARQLAKLLEEDRFTVANIWPELGCILTTTGGGFRHYADQLRPFLGDLPLFSPVYAASEATIGFGYSAEHPYYLLGPQQAYIELLPVEEMEDPAARPIAAWKAEPGKSYEVVITTLGGFMRYRLHDIVRVVDFYGQNPVIEFIERQGQLLDVVGEKTAEHHIVEAIAAACYRVNARLLDYFVTPDTQRTPAGYVLAIEGWQGRSNNDQFVRELLGAVEAALRKTAPDYDEERELGTLGPMDLVLLKPGAFERMREQRIAAGGSANQIKTPHVVSDPGFMLREFQDEMLSRIEARGS